MDNEKVDITISIKKRNLERINDIVDYINKFNKFHNRNLPLYTIEDFIKGATINKLDHLESYYDLSKYQDIGKPFKIKNRFKEIMEEKGLKQKDLCEITGIDKSNISTIVSNKHQPTLDSFFRVWVALDCPSLHEVLYRESE